MTNKRLINECLKTHKAEKELSRYGVITADYCTGDCILLTEELFFKLFKEYEKDETFSLAKDKYFVKYKGVEFFCLKPF